MLDDEQYETVEVDGEDTATRRRKDLRKAHTSECVLRTTRQTRQFGVFGGKRVEDSDRKSKARRANRPND